jgi:adenine-specific DNA-methyltransferase
MELHSEHRSVECTALLWKSDAVQLLRSLKSASVDLIVTSPPYFIGKEYDKSKKSNDFLAEIKRITKEIVRVLKPGGNLCWQIGNHVNNGTLIPLDMIIGSALIKIPSLVLRNRIIWTFNHGEHASTRFSGRHETILWYSNGPTGHFDLDRVRVPQIYPGKRHYKGPNKGEWSGNPLGKNPGDVWDIGDVWGIPNVKANHVEKTDHPCQFPTALVRRLIVALSPEGGNVVDPYAGAATTGVAALLENRSFSGSDIEPRYLRIAEARLNSLLSGTLQVRADVPARAPTGKEKVAACPPHFLYG